METKIGDVAGTIWHHLSQHGEMSVSKLKQGTKLSDQLLFMGLGWLAREGRIALRKTADGRAFELGKAAGLVWRQVCSGGVVARKDLPRATGLPAGLLNEAIGWLVREGKLVVEDRNGARSENGPTVHAAPPATGGTLTLERKGAGREVQIGELAGVIWETLHHHGAMAKEDLGRVTLLAEGLLDQGVGWLAREGKLAINLDRKGHEWFRLKDV
jgi:hypothetical protein